MSNITVAVATHKKYNIISDPLYMPLQVGAALHDALPYEGDDTGDNISVKNASFCELTGLYWIWKNLDADYIGLCHYRRYFANGALFRKGDGILRASDLAGREMPELILPKKRNYFIETNYSQYVHAHNEADLTATCEIISEMYPDYLPFYDSEMKKTVGHRFNMFIMRKELLNSYCTWLFDILFELERRLDTSSYSDYDKRVFGFVSERLLDVYVGKNGIEYKELPVIHTEGQNWLKKGFGFLKRKFIGK